MWKLSVCIGFDLYVYAKDTHQDLMHALSLNIRSWCARSAYTSIPYAYAQCTHQFSYFSNFHFVYPQHTHKELEHTLRVCLRNWCVPWSYASRAHAWTEHRIRNSFMCWAYASGTHTCIEHTMHQELICALSIRIRKLCVPEPTMRYLCVYWAYE